MEIPEKARSHFETYFSLYPDDFYTIEIYAEYLLSLHQREQAASFLQKTCQQETADALPLYLLLANIEARSTNEVQAVDALKNITRYLSPNLAIIEMNRTDFDPIRETEVFQGFLHQLELNAVSLEDRN
jgi:predicted Zn-dependent protease